MKDGTDDSTFDDLGTQDKNQHDIKLYNNETNIHSCDSLSEAPLDSNSEYESTNASVTGSTVLDNTNVTNLNAKYKQKEKAFFAKLETLRIDHYCVLGKKVTCRNIWYFVLIYFLLLMFRTCISSYFYTVAHEIWKRYYTTKFEMEFIVGVEKIGIIGTLIFSSFYGNKFNKPISIMCGAIICGIGAILCAVPYFMLGAREGEQEDSVPTFVQAGLCLTKSADQNISFSDQCSQHPGISHSHENRGAFSILCVGHLLLGMGTAFMVPSGIVYTDEAEERKKLPLFLGVIVSSYGIGLIIGSLFGYWFISYPESLQGDVLIKGWHVGAWWIGFVVFGGLLITFSLCLLIFPKWMLEPKWLLYRKYRAQVKLERWKKKEQELRKRRKQQKREKQKRDQRRKNIKDKHKKVNSAEGNTNLTTTKNDDASSVSNSNEVVNINTSACSVVEQHSSTESAANSKVVASEEDSETEKSNHQNVNNNHFPSNTNNSNSLNIVHDDKAKTSLKTAEPKMLVADSTESVVTENSQSSVPNTKKELKRQKTDEKNRQRYKLGRKLQDLPKNLKFLLSRPIFVVNSIAGVLSLYFIAGYFLTMPQYLKLQYQYSDHVSALIPCMVYGTGVLLGSACSSIIIYKLNLTLPRQLQISLVVQIGVVIGILVLMMLGCNQQRSPLIKDDLGIQSECAISECDCSISEFLLVCNNQSTISYVSPCHAGCVRATLNQDSGTLHYHDCFCESGGEVAPEWCHSNCDIAVVYIIILLVVVTLQSSAYVTMLTLFLRSLPEKLRSITLGFSFWIIYLAAFVPGVAIYNSFYRTSCTLSRNNCQEDPQCWSHDLQKYRYITNGATVAFVLVGYIFLVLSYIVFTKMKTFSSYADNKHKDINFANKNSVLPNIITETNRHTGESDKDEISVTSDQNQSDVPASSVADRSDVGSALGIENRTFEH